MASWQEHYKRMDPTLAEEDKVAGAKFLEEISGEDNLAAIIRVHLYLESTLSLLIQEALPEPGALKLDRLNFGFKIGLGLALGTLPQNLREPLRIVHTLRNRFAHDIHAQLMASDEDRLFKSLSKEHRDSLRGEHDLQNCLAFLYGNLYGHLKAIREFKLREQQG
jgi:hypothetical protein